jgi:hypothetical protein
VRAQARVRSRSDDRAAALRQPRLSRGGSSGNVIKFTDRSTRARRCCATRYSVGEECSKKHRRGRVDPVRRRFELRPAQPHWLCGQVWGLPAIRSNLEGTRLRHHLLLTEVLTHLLAGIYAGWPQEFECAKATPRQWNATGSRSSPSGPPMGVPSSSSETARRHREVSPHLVRACCRDHPERGTRRGLGSASVAAGVSPRRPPDL